MVNARSTAILFVCLLTLSVLLEHKLWDSAGQVFLPVVAGSRFLEVVLEELPDVHHHRLAHHADVSSPAPARISVLVALLNAQLKLIVSCPRLLVPPMDNVQQPNSVKLLAKLDKSRLEELKARQ